MTGIPDFWKLEVKISATCRLYGWALKAGRPGEASPRGVVRYTGDGTPDDALASVRAFFDHSA